MAISCDIDLASPPPNRNLVNVQFDGSVELTRLHYILRDHDADKLEARKARFLANMAFLNEKYGAGTVEVSIVDNYRNMKEMLLPHMHVVEEAKQAMIPLIDATHLIAVMRVSMVICPS